MIRLHRGVLVLVVAALAIAACGGDDDAEPTAWTDDGLETTAAVADDVRAAGFACEGYEEYPFDIIVSTNAALPVPAAMALCTSDDDESLEFVAFADEDAKTEFVTAKQELLCAQAAERDIPFPGYPLVDGGTWTIQPDAPATADLLAEALAAESTFLGCD